MNPLVRLLATLFLIFGAFGISIWVNIVGWGLSIHSWSVIIWGFLFQCVLMILSMAVRDTE